MIEITGNLFNPESYKTEEEFYPDAICVTTNGTLTNTGEAVMGRGCAKEIKELNSETPTILGKSIAENGNHVANLGYLIENTEINIVSFPVKPGPAICLKDKINILEHMKKNYNEGEKVPGWACKAHIKIITRSAKQLVELADTMKWKHVILPRPGCRNGGLAWEKVKPVLQEILDNRFYIITWK